MIRGSAGKPVTVQAAGEKARTAVAAKPSAAVVFTKLTPGKAYTVSIAGKRIGTATPVTAPSPAWGLTVSTTDKTGAVALEWKHQPTKAQGKVAYQVTATPRGLDGRSLSASTAVTSSAPATSWTLDGLDPSVLYTFTVAPANSAGTGKATTAVMNRTLGDIFGTGQVPTDPAPAPASVPTPAGPGTRTIYVCPAGYADAGDTCTDTKAYTFHTEAVPYTYHDVITGPAPMLDSYETAAAACPAGYNLEDYGWVSYCRHYGAAPTQSVKDSTPTGYTDTGTAWAHQVKDTAPQGYADSGTAWVKTVGKVAQVVSA
jgi:hypothetical protein